MSQPSPVLAVEQLGHRYGARQALHGINLQVRAGSLVGLLGPNGGGKSTLLGLLSTRLGLQQGSVKILGHDLRTQAQAIRAQLGVVFQRPALDRRLTVYENLYYGGQIYGLRGAELRQRIDELLNQFRLDDRRQSIVDTLSGGLARRVELAKGLLHRPALVLLDEPSTGLDPAARRDLWNALHQLRAQGVTTIVSTHLAAEGEQCDEVFILHQGQLVASGAPAQLQQQVGGDVLSIQSAQPNELMQAIRRDFELVPQLLEGSLRLECSAAPELIGQLLQKYRDQITSLSIAKPTLEDVFFQRTGQMYDAVPETETRLWPEKRRSA